MTNEYLTPEEVSQRLRVTENTLALWRMRKRPPEYYKFGGKILYDKKDIDAFEKNSIKKPGEITNEACNKQ